MRQLPVALPLVGVPRVAVRAVAVRAVALVLAMSGCGTKATPTTDGLATLGVQAMEITFEQPPKRNGANVTLTLSWPAATPCASAPDVVASFAGEPMVADQATLGGADASGACITTGTFHIDRSDLANAPGQEQMVVLDSATALSMTLDRPFLARHLVPTVPVHTLPRATDIPFTTTDRTSILLDGTATLVSRNTDPVSCGYVVSGKTATLTVPGTPAAGRYRLWVSGNVDLVSACPVARCTATRPATFSQLVDIP